MLTEYKLKSYADKYGTVENGGKTFYITQNPYISDDGTYYEAHAIDADEYDYLIQWDTTEDWKSREIADQWDESEACDWNVFRVIDLTSNEYLEKMYEESRFNNSTPFDEMSIEDQAWDTLERCNMGWENSILEWDNMTREQIIDLLQEFSDHALQELEPLDFIPQRADALLYLLDQTKQELAEDEQE